MIRRIAITGPESTGKSLLANALTIHFGGIYVPEYARTYLQNTNGNYTLDDIVTIAKGQLESEQRLMASAGNYLFADTEMLVCKIWAQVVFGTVPDFIKQAFEDQKYNLYLLCDIDLPWEADPLREHPNRREELMKLYINELNNAGYAYKIVSGTGEQRLKNALKHLAFK